MRAIKIDAENRSFEEIEIRDWKDIVPTIGCRMFTVVGMHDGVHDIYVDDEGFLCNPEYFFQLEGYPSPLAGNGVVIAVNRAGESKPATISIDDLKRQITFLSLHQVKQVM